MTAIQRFISPLAVLTAAATLSACASNGGPVGGYPNQYGYQGQYQGGYQGNNAYSQFGQVTNVEFIRGGGGQSDGITGAVIGGAVGGLAGNQIGGGRGRRAATVAGVVGGALIGRALEQNMNNSGGNYDHYRVTVRFDNGAVRQFDYAQPPNVQIGDRVRAEGNQLYR